MINRMSPRGLLLTLVAIWRENGRATLILKKRGGIAVAINSFPLEVLKSP